jgi:hypothetical protein
LNVDCVLQDDDLQRIARYGLAVLMERVADDGTVFANAWDFDKGRGCIIVSQQRAGMRQTAKWCGALDPLRTSISFGSSRRTR